ncbi:MAG: 50S ribosomal protein L23 [Patescibacteria group bacterium]|jgi:large subunit ribosomal protein L23
MGILDKFKRKKPAEQKKPEEKKYPKKESVKEESKEVVSETVVTPDGRMATVQKKADKKTRKSKQKKEDTGKAYQILIKPLITEKGSSLGINHQYVFEVAPRANKIQVKQAIKRLYDVDVVKVNIINMHGKEIRYGRTEGRTKRWKKAIVTLMPDEKIEIQEGL